MGDEMVTKPLSVWADEEGVTILDAEGWHVCVMSEPGDDSVRLAELIVLAFNTCNQC